MRLACLGAGVVLSSQSLAAPLDIQRLSVYSARGEPLRAVAVIRTESGEQIAPACLSLGDERDLPFPDYPLLRNARVTLSAAGDAVEISTVEPVTAPGVAVVLRVQCPGESLTARHFNLLIRQPGEPAPRDPALPIYPRGTRLTTLHAETVASIARSIHPKSAAARRQLEQAIVAANPDLFPQGKPVPLPPATRLFVPDLRDTPPVAAAAKVPAPVEPEPAPAVETAGPETQPGAPGPRDLSAAPPAAIEPRAPTRLKLRLARAAPNLKRSEGITEARREELRRLYRGEIATVAAVGTDALELKIAQLRESQNAINAQLARLEQAVDSLRRSITAAVSPAPAPPRPAPPPPMMPPAAPLRPEPPWTLWAAAAAGPLLIAALAFLFGRRTRRDAGPVDEHEARIDALLQQARAVAGPLLQSEAEIPRPPARRPLPDSVTSPPRPAPSAPPADEPAAPVRAAPEAPSEAGPLPKLPDYLLEGESRQPPGVDVELEPGPAQPPAGEMGVKTELKREMDLALDSSRSMFTDVDRFISLGRIQNAISLLEFQIHKDPNDRDTWVKLMAVYRQEGMETEFQRAYAEFKRKFPGEV
jgi:hypothetical protein